MGVDLDQVTGTGAAGRITEDDIKAAVRGGQTANRGMAASSRGTLDSAAGRHRRSRHVGPDPADEDGSIRKTIAVNMVKSATTIPHVTNFDDADITELERIRKGGLADYVDSSIKLTMMPFVMKAIAQSLRLHPLLNASIDMEQEQVIYKEYVNIGVAVDTERGLVVPVIRNVDRMSIPAIAKALADVAERARAAQFSLDEMRGATFTISNMGSIGGTYSTPIINPPQRGDSADRPLAQAAGGDRRQDRAAADDAAQLVVRSPAGRRCDGGPLLERSDQLSESSRPAAAVAVSG